MNKNKIVKTKLVVGDIETFSQLLQETIDDFQKDLLEVEVQFKTDVEGFYALVLGRDVGNYYMNDIFSRRK
jgi:hypothetical protein